MASAWSVIVDSPGGGVGRLLLQLLPNASQSVPRFGRLAIGGRRQQIENSRPTTDQFGLGGLAVRRSRSGLGLADQPANLGRPSCWWAGDWGLLPASSELHQHQTVDHFRPSWNLPRAYCTRFCTISPAWEALSWFFSRPSLLADVLAAFPAAKLAKSYA